VGDDSAIGIVFVALFALGVVLIGLLRVRSRDVSAAVVGNLLGIGPGELLLSAALVLLLALAVAGLYRPLALVGFDPIAARAIGLPVGLLEGLLITLVAATVIVAVQVVGVILTVAVLITPAATARLWARRLPTVMLIAATLGATSGALGLYVAYYLPIAPAAVIVLLLTALFVASALLAPRGPSTRRPHTEPIPNHP
jgi:manganese/iron transport system permease protein